MLQLWEYVKDNNMETILTSGYPRLRLAPHVALSKKILNCEKEHFIVANVVLK